MKKYPDNMEPVMFCMNGDPSFGIVNLCCYKDDLVNINNNTRKVVESHILYIHFPLYNNWYTQQYESENGFRFNELIKLIVQTGINSGGVDRFAITSFPDAKDSDIQLHENNIYISIQS